MKHVSGAELTGRVHGGSEADHDIDLLVQQGRDTEGCKGLSCSLTKANEGNSLATCCL